jgi:hypothetical protein
LGNISTGLQQKLDNDALKVTLHWIYHPMPHQEEKYDSSKGFDN